MTATLAPTDILSHIDAGVMTLTINRLDKKNSITASMYSQLADALDAALADGTVRAVVFRGMRRSFQRATTSATF